MTNSSKKSIAFGILFAGILASVAAVLQSGWTSTTNPATARTALNVPGLTNNNSYAVGSSNFFPGPITSSSNIIAARFGVGVAPTVPVDIAASSGAMNLTRYAANDNGQFIALQKSYSATLGTSVLIPNANSQIGKFNFNAANGTGFSTVAAINVFTGPGGHPSSSDMPSYMTFTTTPDGTVGPIDRMIILDNGNIGIGTFSPTSGRLVVDGGGITFGTDNTYDIGASGANRPNDIFAGGNVSAPSASFGYVALELGNFGFSWAGGPSVTASSANILKIVGDTTLNLVQLGGPSSSFPGLQVNGAGLNLVGAPGIGTSSNNFYASGSIEAGTHIIARTNIAQFDVTITDFVIGTRYTNSNRRSFVAASFQLAAAVAGTAAVTFNVEQAGTTNKLTVSSGPLAGLTTIEPLALPVSPGAFYYFTDTSSGAGAVASIVAGTSSQTGF